MISRPTVFLSFVVNWQTKDGKKWDGNGKHGVVFVAVLTNVIRNVQKLIFFRRCCLVPTNYRIKAKPNGKKLTEEDKNLGRWVNRQRSLFQAGKLRKDRQLVSSVCVWMELLPLPYLMFIFATSVGIGKNWP